MSRAQAVQHKHLLISASGGAGVMALVSDRVDLTTTTACNAFRFSFAYALSDKWSLGVHYDRIGSNEPDGDLDRLHLTTYLLEGTYRPWIGDRAVVECTVGLGASAASLFPEGARLPYTASGGAFTLGVRYVHLLSNTVGLMVGSEHAMAGAGNVLLEGDSVNPDGSVSTLEWNSQRLTAGMVVRF